MSYKEHDLHKIKKKKVILPDSNYTSTFATYDSVSVQHT